MQDGLGVLFQNFLLQVSTGSRLKRVPFYNEHLSFVTVNGEHLLCKNFAASKELMFSNLSRVDDASAMGLPRSTQSSSLLLTSSFPFAIGILNHN